ncbi:MAG: SsrA-binding protein SmpB [Bacteroidota bacterium]
MAVEIKNKKAGYTYFLEDEFDAGIQLLGSEIKSIRSGKASIVEGYCRFKNNELWVYNTYIAEYENSGYVTHKPKRPRKLLLKRQELDKLQKKMKNVGLTIVPILVYIGESGFAKMKIAIAKGKKLHDKRSDLKEKSLKRDIDRALR